MCGRRPLFYSVLFVLFNLIRITHPTYHDSGHGYITKNSQYFDDELSHIHEEMGSQGYFHNIDSLGMLNLRLEPEFLDFSERSLGVPHSKTVRLFNTDSNKSIDLTSISGNTVHFHSSFFEDKQIPPNGNTTFKVVYLGRHEGPIESTLFLHTSIGFIKYNVKALGTYNSYRLRPIVGVKLPVNSTFTPIIYMHNPHSEPIQIVEIYSSGGGFHLELPGGHHEGPNELWEIDPYETKAVIRVRFEAKVPHNHTAYIRIKLHNPEEILIVPLEIEVTETQGIFHPQGYLDFGVGGTLNEPKEINLCLINPLRKTVRIHSVSTPSKSIKTQYYNARINPWTQDENDCVNVGTLAVDWKNAWQSQDFYGKIIVKFRNGKNRTEIPYFISVLKGGLSYDKASTTYFLSERQMDTSSRNFQVVNKYYYPIKVLDLRIPGEVDSLFKIQSYTPVMLRPFEKKTLFDIQLKKGVKKTDMQLSSRIKVLTNISEITVPFLSYNGKIQIYLPYTGDERMLDMGLVGHYKQVQAYLILTNPNPIDLNLLKLSTSLPRSQVELHGCGEGDHRLLFANNRIGNLTKCGNIKAQHFAVIRLTVNTNNQDGLKRGEVQIATPFENLSIAVAYKVASGELIIDKEDLVFNNCFPSKACTHPLRIFSTYSEKMNVEGISSLPADKRVSYNIVSSILPKMNRVIATLKFNPDLDCSPDCYTGFLSEGSASWLKTLLISRQVSDYDLKLVNLFYQRYSNFTKNSANATSSMTFRLDTSEVKGQMFVSRVNFTWPSVVEEGVLINQTLEFPLTQVRNRSSQDLILHNPSNHPLVMQLIFENDYPHAELLLEGLPENFIPNADVKCSTKKWFSFDESTLDRQQKIFWTNLRLNIYKYSLPVILGPGQSRKVTLEFHAEEAKTYSSLLFIRNNLTMIELVRLVGKGAKPRFEFTSLKSLGPKMAHFELTEKQMKPCNPDLYSKPYLPYLTTKASFLATNLGEIPVYISRFLINGFNCEGYGFKVIDCEPFSLMPNSSKTIDILFTPDLALHEVSRMLHIQSSLNTCVNYTLKAKVSRSYCRHCSVLQGRPPFEIYMSKLVNMFLVINLILVLTVSVWDANNLKNKTMGIYCTSNNSPPCPVLDLRSIGRQVREEIQSSLKEEEKSESLTSGSEESLKSEPAIIPTQGKSKKKLCQQNSNEREDSIEEDIEKPRLRERPKKKEILFQTHRLKSIERKNEKELKLLEENRKKEKHKQAELKNEEIKRKKRPSTSIQRHDQEISLINRMERSNSSNSSSNSEEIDKENQRVSWSKRRVNILSQTGGDSKDNPEAKIKHVSFVNSKLRRNGKTSTLPDQSKDTEPNDYKGDDKTLYGYFSAVREKRRRDPKFNKEHRKDVQSSRKKNNLERKNTSSTSESVNERETNNQPEFYIPLPATTTSNSSWCESKARFSDVVARTDNCHDQTPESTHDSESPQTCAEDDTLEKLEKTPIKVNPSSFKPSSKPTCKPTMYVEPYKPIDLGPIGSKRLGTPDSAGHSPDLFTQEAQIHSPFVPPTSRPTTEFNPMNDSSVIAAVTNNTIISSSGTSSFFTQPQASVLGDPLGGGAATSFPSNSAILNPLVSGLSTASSMHRSAGTATNFFGQPQTSGLLGDDLTHATNAFDGWTRQPIFRDLTARRDDTNRPSLFGSVDEDESWKNMSLHPQSHHTSDNKYWSNTFSSVLNSTSKPANNASYLWGSNPIWKPWTPADSPTHVRRPPGFNEENLEKKEEEQSQFSANYNAFGNGNSPWSQPWK
ncbi:transmembrane protein 131 [Anthonomus grandis grandis]|uniref:transmembrane protein 131 n=1 Tax=Anthonomus grandis grandis TaxID=2921223 RepID=UPI0021669615|nr:transmembrane protein 131 [Anthonomus grandis grandis]